MKKRILALLLAAVMLLSLSGCDSREKPEPEETPNQEEVQTPEVKPEEPEEKQEVEEEIVIEKPELGEEIAELKAKNDDVVGWLQIPDTEIDNAVVQTTNNEFYLRKDELKQYSWTGCYWIDFECTVGPTAEDLGRSTVIYGHNVNYDDGKDKERFSQLFHFADEQWAKEHPYIYFSTPEEDMAWEVFAVAYTTDDFNYIQVLKDRKVSSEQITEAQMINIVNEARERSEYDYNDVEVNGDDKIITLSTCSYKYGRRNDVRFIVMAKLVTEEDTPVETANITINEDKKEVQ
ncbi:MAG: class B sortase [Oscillospiraceae bacterium]|nr:class B sortase [Oscillospiraceae bacterium]